MPKGSLNAKPKPIFNGTVMASAGSSELGEKWNDANLSKWLRNYGGRFAPDFDDSVTHLIASKDQFKQMNNRGEQRFNASTRLTNGLHVVKEALKRKKVQIVLVDWLEMSMAANKLLPIKNYSLTTIRKEANAKKRRSEQKERDIRNGVNYVNTSKWNPDELAERELTANRTLLNHEEELTKMSRPIWTI